MPLRTAVIGAGHLGRQHARLHANLAAEGRSQFVAVCDVDDETARSVSVERKTDYVSDWRELIGRVDAVSLAVPTASHCEIACGLLEAGGLLPVLETDFAHLAKTHPLTFPP